jgi:hypothetical protein
MQTKSVLKVCRERPQPAPGAVSYHLPNERCEGDAFCVRRERNDGGDKQVPVGVYDLETGPDRFNVPWVWKRLMRRREV